MEKVTVKVVRTEGDWLALVEACKKSGVSAAVFCRGQGVSYPLFLYHRGKILKKRGELVSSRGLGIFPTAGGRRAFIPVQVSEGRSVRLKFPRGLVLESNELPNASWLVEVAWRWNELETSLC